MFLRSRLLLIGLMSLIASSCAREEAIPDLYPVPDFHLTERSGRTVGRDDLSGHVWIAEFHLHDTAAVLVRESPSL